MISETLKKMEQVLGKVVAKPIPEILAELQEIADRDKKNPAPHLAMALVTGFYGISHLDLQGARKHLDHAEKLLKGGRETTPEWQFSENLYNLLKSDASRIDVLEPPKRELTEKEKESLAKAAIDSRWALMHLGLLRRRLRESALVDIIYSGLRALSFSSGTQTRDFRLGRARLARIFRGRGESRDLAGFFLMYAYRKNRNYRQAIRTGQILEKRNPRSPLAKKMLGTAYQRAGRYREAEGYFKKVISLVPNDPSGYLCYVRVLEKMGQLEKATEHLRKAESLDTRRELVSVIDQIKAGMAIKRKLLPQLKELGWA